MDRQQKDRIAESLKLILMISQKHINYSLKKYLLKHMICWKARLKMFKSQKGSIGRNPDSVNFPWATMSVESWLHVVICYFFFRVGMILFLISVYFVEIVLSVVCMQTFGSLGKTWVHNDLYLQASVLSQHLQSPYFCYHILSFHLVKQKIK